MQEQKKIYEIIYRKKFKIQYGVFILQVNLYNAKNFPSGLFLKFKVLLDVLATSSLFFLFVFTIILAYFHLSLGW